MLGCDLIGSLPAPMPLAPAPSGRGFVMFLDRLPRPALVADPVPLVW
jgi:hypothetical protein